MNAKQTQSEKHPTHIADSLYFWNQVTKEFGDDVIVVYKPAGSNYHITTSSNTSAETFKILKDFVEAQEKAVTVPQPVEEKTEAKKPKARRTTTPRRSKPAIARGTFTGKTASEILAERRPARSVVGTGRGGSITGAKKAATSTPKATVNSTGTGTAEERKYALGHGYRLGRNNYVPMDARRAFAESQNKGSNGNGITSESKLLSIGGGTE